MNSNFKSAVDFYKPIVKLSHRQDVTRLYKSCIKNIFGWTDDYVLANEEAVKLRNEFRSNMHLPPDSAKTTRLMREAKERLEANTNPDPYIRNYMPSGSLFMRNPPISLEALYPDGIPEGMNRRRLNIDMSNVPPEQEWADDCFVDTVNKTYWINK